MKTLTEFYKFAKAKDNNANVKKVSGSLVGLMVGSHLGKGVGDILEQKGPLVNKPIRRVIFAKVPIGVGATLAGLGIGNALSNRKKTAALANPVMTANRIKGAVSAIKDPGKMTNLIKRPF